MHIKNTIWSFTTISQDYFLGSHPARGNHRIDHPWDPLNWTSQSWSFNSKTADSTRDKSLGSKLLLRRAGGPLLGAPAELGRMVSWNLYMMRFGGDWTAIILWASYWTWMFEYRIISNWPTSLFKGFIWKSLSRWSTLVRKTQVDETSAHQPCFYWNEIHQRSDGSVSLSVDPTKYSSGFGLKYIQHN